MTSKLIEANPLIETLIRKTDPDQFRKRRALVALIADDGFVVTEDEQELITGLVEFLDEIANIAKNVYGIDGYLPTMFDNYCRCCACGKEWHDLWYSPMDNCSCPDCGTEVQPSKIDVQPFNIEEIRANSEMRDLNAGK